MRARHAENESGSRSRPPHLSIVATGYGQGAYTKDFLIFELPAIRVDSIPADGTRRQQNLRKKYAALAAGREHLGFGLKPGPAKFLSRLIECLPTSPTAKFAPREPVTPTYFLERYNQSFDTTQAWSEVLEAPVPCPLCARGHALLRVDRGGARGAYRAGRQFTYSLLACSDFTDEQTVSFEQAAAKKPRVRPVKRASQVELFPRKVSENPDTFAGNAGSVEPQSIGETPTLSGGDGGSSYAREVVLLNAIVDFHTLPLGSAAIAAVAAVARSAGAQDAASYEAALRGAYANAHRTSLAIETVERDLLADWIAPAVERSTETVQVGMAARVAAADADWATARIVELARRKERGTTEAQGRVLVAELHAWIKRRGITDEDAIARETERVLTDPRVCKKSNGIDDHPNPIAALRTGIAPGAGDGHGYLAVQYAADDGSGKMDAAWKRIDPGMIASAERLLLAHLYDGEALDRKKLSDLRYGPKMVAHRLLALRAEHDLT